WRGRSPRSPHEWRSSIAPSLAPLITKESRGCPDHVHAMTAVVPCDHFTNSAMASSASTPPVIEMGAKGALAATSALESMIWLILVASCATDAAKTSRPTWHQRIAPMHIAHGPPEVYTVPQRRAALR